MLSQSQNVICYQVWLLPLHALVLLPFLSLVSLAEEVDMTADESTQDVPEEASESSGATTPMKTLGGLQFWSDLHFFHEWRIQKNVFTGHHRLLDGKDYRYASGTFEECLEMLNHIRRERRLPPMSGKAVVLVHGVVRSAKSMSPMRVPFQNVGYSVFSFGYPSTRVEIQDAAELLHRALTSLEGIEEIDFVVHSMGGLVTRAYLAKHQDARIHRVVMLGVPNLGAHMADRLKEFSLYRTIFGPSGQQLVTDPDGLIANLPIPDCEFAIIAGSRGTPDGYNPLIPGDDDGTVSVESTRLPGAADFVTVRSIHSFLMNSQEVIDYAIRFIQTGRLRDAETAQPIPRPEDESNSKTQRIDGERNEDVSRQ